MTDTTAELAAARIREALEAGPTPGPWDSCGSLVYLAGDGGFDMRNCPAAAENAAYIAACSPDALRALLAERDELAKDAARWRLVAGHWKDASMRWKKEPNVPKSITLTVDFGVVAAEAAQIEGFLDEAVRAALTNKD